MVKIRPATPDDAEAIDELIVAAWKTSYRGAIPDAVADAQQTGPRGEFLRSLLPPRPPVHIAVATAGSAVVGFVHVGPNRDDDDVAVHEIWGLYVSPDHQRTGIGRTLLRHALEWIKSAGGSAATLWTLRDVDGTRRFYEALGGEWDSTEKSDVVGGSTLPQVRYRFHLAEASDLR